MSDRTTDLHRPLELPRHAVRDTLKLRCETLHLKDYRGNLPTDSTNNFYIVAYLLAELIHFAYALGNRILYLFDHLLDFLGRVSRLIRQPLDFFGDNDETCPIFSCLLGFNRGVEGD